MSTTARPIAADLTPDGLAAALAHLTEHVDRSGGPDACWPYTGGSKSNGYGVFHVRKADGKRRLIKAHRLAFEAETGTCPPTVDHTCHDAQECRDTAACPHRPCCNPQHLAPATKGQNAARSKTGVYAEMCRAGLHRMTDDNVYVNPRTGGRSCKACAARRTSVRRREAAAQKALSARAGRAARPHGLTAAGVVRWALGDLLERAKSDPELADMCWPWPQTVSPSGYAYVSIAGVSVLAHRLVHEVLVGPIPEGHHVDHRCHDPKACSGGMACPHRACANPRHLRAVKPGENNSAERSAVTARETCPAGHLYDDENTYVAPGGGKACRACVRRNGLRAAKKARGGQPDRRFRSSGVCRNGHDTAAVGLDGDGKCVQCHRDSGARLRKAKQDAGLVRVQRRDDETCRRGHDMSEDFYLNKRGVKECNQCRRERNAAKRAATKRE